MRSAPSALAILWKSIASDEWQLRHSRELVAVMSSHTRRAIARRFSSNFSGVAMVPSSLW